ncbi:MAG TPA: phosphatase PAP2 family protein, partial [Rhizobacter sp.]|nr:phosphatase PAP2 family protein [Rhizobacter sp.]
LSLAWMVSLAFAVLVTTVTKVAFIGYGLGVAAINFTGVSGHAMFAAAVYPLVFGALASSLSAPAQRTAVLLGAALALLIGISRVQLFAHSWSEVATGLALGGSASAAALWVARMPHVRVPGWLPAGVLVWLLVMPTQAPPSRTHDLVTRLSLALSGRSEPYTRRAMLAAWHQQRAGETKLLLRP